MKHDLGDTTIGVDSIFGTSNCYALSILESTSTVFWSMWLGFY